MCSVSLLIKSFLDDDGGESGEINLYLWKEGIEELLNGGFGFNLKDSGDIDEIVSNKDELSFVVLLSSLTEGEVDFDERISISSSHVWLNKSDNTENIRWQRLQVRSWSISLDKPPVWKNK
jgi:hypothetical protein